MVLEKLEKKRIILLAILAYIILLFFPYILKGGFVIDDWGIPYVAQQSHAFWENYVSWFPLFSNRPLAPLVLTFFSRIFGTWATGYILFNLAFWISSLVITGYVLQKYTSKTFSYLFFLFALTPIISGTLIFSPGMQLTATFSFFVWSLSLLSLKTFLNRHKWQYLLLSNLLLLICLLEYEIVLPLILINVFLPLFSEDKPAKKGWSARFIKFTLPPMFVLIITFLFQKVIMPKFMPVFSRLDFSLNSHKIFETFWAWLSTIIIDIPILFYSAIKYPFFSRSSKIEILILGGIIFILFYLLSKKQKTKLESPSTENKNNYLIVIFIVTLLACSFLYLLSGRPPKVLGYESRGLSSTWFSFSLIIAFLGHKLQNKKAFNLFALLLFLVALVFMIERNNYINSYQLQLSVIEDCINKFNNKATPDSVPKSETTMLGNVPQFVVGNFINEEVFYYYWDFGYALNLLSNGKIAKGNTLTYSKIYDKKLNFSDSENKIVLDGDWTAKIDNAWFYEYDQTNKKSRLVKLSDKKSLEDNIKDIELSSERISPPSFFWKNRGDVINFLTPN